ncbi:MULTISPECIES: hypothetical protein [Paraburkholderia]|uniref:Uncharacterized protein n=2 Tax=Paraburkholderia TaxID=1822464 RepID=A0ABU9SMB6_9BURK
MQNLALSPEKRRLFNELLVRQQRKIRELALPCYKRLCRLSPPDFARFGRLPQHEKIGKLAELLAENRDRFSYMNWGEQRHFWGAFKMDAPGDAKNTRRLFGFLVNK